MRIHTNAGGVANYIGALAKSITIDPGSLESWFCLHLCFSSSGLLTGLQAGIVEKLLETHADSDCDIFCCENTDIFIISRALSAAALYQLADEILLHSGGLTAEIKAYDLCQHWRTVRELLIEKSGVLVSITGADIGKDKYKPNGCFGDVEALSSTFKEAATFRRSRSSLYIMIVEDDPMTRRVVSEVLSQRSFVIQAPTAYDAVINYLLHAPDIVFLDIGLPDASGLKVLQQIVSNDPHAYVVMFSGDGHLDNVLNALNSGASGFITKPFSKQKLHQYIENGAAWHNKSVEG